MKFTIKTPPATLAIASLCPKPENDAELEWLFEEAETAVSSQSNYLPTVDDGLDGSRGRVRIWHAAEARADALHRANKILGWLQSMPRELSDVLVAAYEPQRFTPHVELAFGRLAGVAAALRSVRVDFQRERVRGRTHAMGPPEWLGEVVRRGDEARIARVRIEAMSLYARALAAYRKARGDGPSLVGER